VDFLAADISPGQRGWSVRIGRRWWILALGLVLGLLAGQRYLAHTPKQFSSTASVDVELAQAVVAQAQLRSTAMSNELLWAQSPLVAQKAKALLHWTVDTTTLQSQVTETIPTNSQLITFTFAGSTPQQAQSGAEAFAQAFLNQRDGLRAADQARREQNLSAQQAATQAKIQQYTAQLALPPNTPQHDYATSQLALLRNQADLLNVEQTDITLAGSQVALMVDNASLPTAPTKPVPLLILAAAMLLGLIVSGTIAILLARRDRRVRVPG
jgi:polysaccharide biosynthesis transport protein